MLRIVGRTGAHGLEAELVASGGIQSDTGNGDLVIFACPIHVAGGDILVLDSPYLYPCHACGIGGENDLIAVLYGKYRGMEGIGGGNGRNACLGLGRTTCLNVGSQGKRILAFRIGADIGIGENRDGIVASYAQIMENGTDGVFALAYGDKAAAVGVIAVSVIGADENAIVGTAVLAAAIRPLQGILVGMSADHQADAHLIQKLRPFLINGLKGIGGIVAEGHVAEDHADGIFFPFPRGNDLTEPLGLLLAVAFKICSTAVGLVAVYLILAGIQNKTEDPRHFHTVISAGGIAEAGNTVQIMCLSSTDLVVASGIDGGLTTLGNSAGIIQEQLQLRVLGQGADIVSVKNIDVVILRSGDLHVVIIVAVLIGGAVEHGISVCGHGVEGISAADRSTGDGIVGGTVCQGTEADLIAVCLVHDALGKSDLVVVALPVHEAVCGIVKPLPPNLHPCDAGGIGGKGDLVSVLHNKNRRMGSKGRRNTGDGYRPQLYIPLNSPCSEANSPASPKEQEKQGNSNEHREEERVDSFMHKHLLK